MTENILSRHYTLPDTQAWEEVGNTDTARGGLFIRNWSTSNAEVEVSVGHATADETDHFLLEVGAGFDFINIPSGPIYIRSKTAATAEVDVLIG